MSPCRKLRAMHALALLATSYQPRISMAASRSYRVPAGSQVSSMLSRFNEDVNNVIRCAGVQDGGAGG